jgi:hypothetical protein
VPCAVCRVPCAVCRVPCAVCVAFVSRRCVSFGFCLCTHREKVPGRYAVLLEFRQQVMADQFYLEYNGKMYNSMEVTRHTHDTHDTTRHAHTGRSLDEFVRVLHYSQRSAAWGS